MFELIKLMAIFELFVSTKSESFILLLNLSTV